MRKAVPLDGFFIIHAMKKSNKSVDEKVIPYLSVGLMIGLLVGNLTDNIGLWLSLGLALGASAGYAQVKKK